MFNSRSDVIFTPRKFTLTEIGVYIPIYPPSLRPWLLLVLTEHGTDWQTDGQTITTENGACCREGSCIKVRQCRRSKHCHLNNGLVLTSVAHLHILPRPQIVRRYGATGLHWVGRHGDVFEDLWLGVIIPRPLWTTSIKWIISMAWTICKRFHKALGREHIVDAIRGYYKEGQEAININLFNTTVTTI